MPERCASRCSTVTPSPTSGRSSPSSDRAVVSSRSVPCSTSAMTVTAVRLFVPLAMANCVSTVAGMPWARSASPYAAQTTVSPSRSTRTAPEKPVRSATSATSVCRVVMAGQASPHPGARACELCDQGGAGIRRAGTVCPHRYAARRPSRPGWFSGRRQPRSGPAAAGTIRRSHCRAPRFRPRRPRGTSCPSRG